MDNDGLSIDQRSLRGADSNSLLRLYDLARERRGNSQTQQQRVRADKAIERIVTELQRRQVSY
jgi:hypothetical protein